MSYYEWRPYVPVADRRRKAEKKLAKLKMKGQTIDPVRIEGRTIAKSFWGRSWCTNLERYSDFASCLQCCGTYVDIGSVPTRRYFRRALSEGDPRFIGYAEG